MAFFGKVFKFEREENFGAFVDKLGLPAKDAEAFKTSRMTQKLVQNNDGTYTLIITAPEFTKEFTFKSGVQFDEEVVPGKPVTKTTFTLNGNVLTQEHDVGNGKIVTYKRTYSDSGDKLIHTCHISDWDGTATRYYSA